MRRYIATLFLLALAVCGPLHAQLPLRTGLPEPSPHPRLFLGKGEEDALVKAISRDNILGSVDSVIMSYCDSMLSTPVLHRVMTGRRLLSTSREAVKRIFYLSYGYRIHGNPSYAKRAIDEMKAVCSFRDWNPYHFLDVGEMALAVGIGYDWLYDLISPEEKELFKEAMMEKAFTPSKDEDLAWFYDSAINWNQVCNAGLTVGAIAFFDEMPFESGRITTRAIGTIHLPLDGAYSPEGCYAEGYSYWGYGTSFQILMAAALESAFGTDCGILEGKDGFLNSSRFMMMMSTPALQSYNFGDCSPGATAQYMQAWMALRHGDVSVLRPEVDIMKKKSFSSFTDERLLPFFMICGARLSGEGYDLDNLPSPEENFFECGGTTPIYIYRSGWGDPGDTYFAIKGGKASSSHSHCDAGAFFFEGDGIGWAVDLGTQNYNSLESLGLDIWNTKQQSDRWKVYRTGPFSHNIITINGKVPEVDSFLGIGRTWKEEGMKGAELPLGLFYMNDLDTFYRKATLDENNDLFIRDSLVNGSGESLIRWQMCTEADPSIQPDGSIVLESGTHSRVLTITALPGYGEQSPLEAVPYSEDALSGNDYDAPNPGKHIVGFSFRLPPDGRINVLVTLRKIR
ncbi:MAG: heparinase II/III family protein [Bacteroidales bacterium]|nr:heparinase II/III family protein [Bacteroidales bacterium]